MRDDGDRVTFLAILADSVRRYGVFLHAYCLLDNHFHLLVETPQANLPEFLRRLKITYASAYNRRHGRSGHLFQGPYKAIHLDRDEAFTAVSRYIHLNPVRTARARRTTRAQRIADLKAYRWSSLPDYLGRPAHPQAPPVTIGLSLAPCGGATREGRERYWRDLLEDLETGRDPVEEAVAGVALGSTAFMVGLDRRLAGSDTRELPAARRLRAAARAERVLAAVGKAVGLGTAELLTARGRPRHLLMDAWVRHARMLNVEIARRLGVSESAVCVGLRRLRCARESDPALGAKMVEIEQFLNEQSDGTIA